MIWQTSEHQPGNGNGNLNTVVILTGFAGGLVAWGATWERVSSSQGVHAQALDRLDKRITAVEVTIRQLDNHELRIFSVEKQAAEAATSMRAVETSIGNSVPICALSERFCSASRQAKLTEHGFSGDQGLTMLAAPLRRGGGAA